MRFARFTIYILIIILLAAAPAHALKRLRQAMERYNGENYSAALSKVKSYLTDYPRDEAALDMKEMISKKLAAGKLKKAYTLKGEGADNEASGILQEVLNLAPEYAQNIESRYKDKLENMNSKEAVDSIILYMLRNPAVEESREYEVSRHIRQKLASSLSDAERVTFEEIKRKVDILTEDKKFNRAVELVSDYLNNNPGSSEARMLLSEINRKAARYFYDEAVRLINRGKKEEGSRQAAMSKNYDAGWFANKVDESMDEAKMSLAVGDRSQAESKLRMLSHLIPSDSRPSLYLSLFEEDRTGFLQRSVELYRNRQYEEAMVRFDFFRLNEPDNREAQLYYHMAAARKYIRQQDLEKVKEHLISVLKISPGEKEALEIYDRLQDVMEIMG
ncbi:MAG: hypothetical protein U9R36_04995 [Elusimicrobiota bacterium]|nr:hypothetical protein [Elusimicrobiota bacterium]